MGARESRRFCTRVQQKFGVLTVYLFDFEMGSSVA